MINETEAQLEAALIKDLSGTGWDPVKIVGEVALWDNLRRQLEAFNSEDLGGELFTEREWSQVRIEIERGDVFDKAHILRSRFPLTRDDGTVRHIRFFNKDEWCRNRYQIASQISVKGRRKNRYDVTLLINGFPLCQIELKRTGVELNAAFHQINRYQKDSFKAAGGLFRYVQIFVISNGVNTRYYANNKDQSYKQTFTWSTPDNHAINRLCDFADAFLEKCHLSKMIARYVVLHESSQSLMVLRPYQYYAAEAITEAVMLRTGDGYVWHTTGSGKTLTSFKAAQNLVALPKVDKVVFVVDRHDLDFQTVREFNCFQKDCVDELASTRALVDKLVDPAVPLVVTTIQKLNGALSNDRHQAKLEPVLKGRVVFIFDECHRSQFGESHVRIRRAFTQAQMFGFTGTPIFVENAIGGRTTGQLFGRQLHTYVITDAIRDGNVLRFSVEYQDTPAKDISQRSPEDAKRLLEHPKRIRRIAEWIVANHGTKTHGRRYGAIMAVGSVDALIAYYEAFRDMREEGLHDLAIATIFTYADNEDDADANGFLPSVDFPTGTPTPAMIPRRDLLSSFVGDYNTTFGTNEKVTDAGGFYTYYQAIAKRVKRRDEKPPILLKDGIDILLVVNMFLTGFDAKTVNTIYVDKNLRHHGLIQAFSRTNRILNAEKSQGNVVCFRDLREQVDEAVALFADRNAKDTILIGSYAENLQDYRDAVEKLLGIVPDADAVDDLLGEQAQAAFAKAFRDVIRLRNVLESFVEFNEDAADDAGLDGKTFAEFRSKYLDLSEESRKASDAGEAGPLADMDFELELIARVEINVDYIIGLLTRLTDSVRKAGPASAEAEDLRRRIYETLSSEPQFRSNKEVIRSFIEDELPGLPANADVSQAFTGYWARRRADAFSALVKDENLDEQLLQDLLEEMTYSRKNPIAEDIVPIMLVKPTIKERRPAVRRIIERINDITETFDRREGS